MSRVKRVGVAAATRCQVGERAPIHPTRILGTTKNSGLAKKSSLPVGFQNNRAYRKTPFCAF